MRNVRRFARRQPVFAAPLERSDVCDCPQAASIACVDTSSHGLYRPAALSVPGPRSQGAPLGERGLDDLAAELVGASIVVACDQRLPKPLQTGVAQ